LLLLLLWIVSSCNISTRCREIFHKCLNRYQEEILEMRSELWVGMAWMPNDKQKVKIRQRNVTNVANSRTEPKIARRPMRRDFPVLGTGYLRPDFHYRKTPKFFCFFFLTQTKLTLNADNVQRFNWGFFIKETQITKNCKVMPESLVSSSVP
jgi:hypothetical protein